MDMRDGQERLKIVMKRVDEITPYANNPRKNERTALALKKSIDAFGFKNPIIIDENNVIVSGHARLKAAIMLGMDEVPCTYADGLTEDEIRAFRIADNKTAEAAGWDYDLLMEEMTSLKNDGFDLDFTAFNEAEQLFYGEPDLRPEKVDRQEYKAYEQAAENNILQSFNVAITCENDDEKDWLRALIHENRTLKRLYRVDELYELRELAREDGATV